MKLGAYMRGVTASRKTATGVGLAMNRRMMSIALDKTKFTDHVRRVCCSNIRKPCKICILCPFREYVLAEMEENGWKLPADMEDKRG